MPLCHCFSSCAGLSSITPLCPRFRLGLSSTPLDGSHQYPAADLSCHADPGRLGPATPSSATRMPDPAHAAAAVGPVRVRVADHWMGARASDGTVHGPADVGGGDAGGWRAPPPPGPTPAA